MAAVMRLPTGSRWIQKVWEQVDVPTLRPGRLRPTDDLGLIAVPAVDPPPAAIRDPADLLHIQVHHVSGPAGGDLPRLPVVLAARVDEAAFAEAESGQVSAHGSPVDHKPDTHKFVGDPLRGPLALAAPGLDLLDDPCWSRVRTPVRARRLVLQSCIAV
ncbi:hypothetical protein QF037_009297 [Streptomyces canus]|nr:hypothetical protein [Streptomyces canus]